MGSRGEVRPGRVRGVIREDYLLGWIKRYLLWLAEIAGFIRTADYEAAARRADLALRELLGLGPDSVLALTDGEILARLAMGDPPVVVRDKCLMVAALLYHLGHTAAGKGNADLARDCWLKSLQVVLGTYFQGAGPLPEFAPQPEALIEALRDAVLPARTEAALILFHEQHGQFDRAENALFRLLERMGPEGEAGVIEMGLGFYRRLAVLSEESLAAGNFSREEVVAGRQELERRRAS